MFDIKKYRSFVESKIVFLGSKGNSLTKPVILDFCSQWNKSSTTYFNKNCTRVLQRVFGDNLRNKPSGMSVNTYMLLEFGYKRCNVCAGILALKHFSKSSKNSTGFQSACKNCVSKARKENAANINYLTAKRRAIKAKAQPSWLTEEQLREIKQLYIKARTETKETGVTYNGGHIIA